MKKKNGNGHELAVVAEPSVGNMLAKIIEAGVTEQNVGALAKMVDLYERMQDRSAEREFNQAFADLQAELPKVEALKPVKGNDGTVHYCYAPFEDIMAAVQAVLTKHKFAVSFNTRYEADRLIAVCILRHAGGHSQSNEFGVRVSDKIPNASVTQADGAAKTYAKRNAISDALNIVVEHDDDARLLGKPICKADAQELYDRIHALGDKVDEQAFLKYAGVAAKDPATVEDYENIYDTKLDHLFEMLEKKERGKSNGKQKSEKPEDKEFDW